MVVRNAETALVGTIAAWSDTVVKLKEDLNMTAVDGNKSVQWEGAKLSHSDTVEFEENGFSCSQSFSIFCTDENNMKKTCTDARSNCAAVKTSHHVTIGVKCAEATVRFERSSGLDFGGFVFKDLPEVINKRTHCTRVLTTRCATLPNLAGARVLTTWCATKSCVRSHVMAHA